jgi:hypothetical protein
MPDPGVAGDQQDADRQLLRCANQVGGEHDKLPGQTIGPDAANEIKGNTAHQANGEDQAQLRRGASDPQDGKGERDRHEAVANGRGRLAGPEQPKARLG